MPVSGPALPPRRIFRRTRVVLFVPAVLAAAALAAGCSSSAPPQSRPSSLTRLVVDAVPGEGSAGLAIAQDQGLFSKAGLKVTIEAVASSSAAIPAMLQDKVQIVSGQYSSYVAAQASGQAKMTILAAGFSLGPRVQQVMVGPGSPISSPAQLRGATIAVNALNSETTDLLFASLVPYGISPGQVHVVQMPFPVMPAALAAGKVNAIYAIEPYATEASEKYGDQELLDIDSGATAGFPINGFASLTAWADTHLQAAAAFARAIEQGNAIATSDPAVLERAMETSLHVNAQVADVMATGTFPTDVDPITLARVPDLMLEYRQLTKQFDLNSMIGR